MSEMSANTMAMKRTGFVSRTLQAANRVFAKSLFRFLAMPLLLWLGSQGVAQAVDLAKNGAVDAKDTFGQGSSVMYYIMLAEAVLIFLAFLKAQNPAILLLIPVFIVGTRIVFGLIGSPK